MPRLLEGLAGRWRMVPVIVTLAIIWLYFWSQNPLFLGSRNLSNLAVQIVVTSTIALGLLFVLLIGEIDLSVAALAAVSAAISADLAVSHGIGMVPAIVVVVAVEAAIGGLQGGLVTAFRAPSFIVTLGGSLVLQGVLLQILPTDSNLISLVGQPISGIATTYLPGWLGYALVAAGISIFVLLSTHSHVASRQQGLSTTLFRSTLLPMAALGVVGAAVVSVLNSYRGVPLPVAILLGLLAIFTYVTTQTSFGLHLYAIGTNIEAARRSGVPVARIRIVAFMLMGALAALGGIIAAGRVMGVSPDSADPTVLLEAIAAAVIGGASLFGGERAAIIYTIIESAKLNGLDPEAYLATVLDRLARGHLNTRLDEFLPWNYQPPLAAAV